MYLQLLLGLALVVTLKLFLNTVCSGHCIEEVITIGNVRIFFVCTAEAQYDATIWSVLSVCTIYMYIYYVRDGRHGHGHAQHLQQTVPCFCQCACA